MRKWLSLCVVLCLLSGGCQTVRKPEARQPGESGTEAYSAPAPLSSQDQDVGTPINPVLPESPAPSITPSPTPEPPTAPPAPPPTPSPTRSPQPAASKPPEQSTRTLKKNQAKATDAPAAKTNTVKRLTLTELRKKYSSSFIFQGSASKKRIALTFDDAPDTEYTPQILDILKKYRVKATFFVVGYRAAEHPEIVKRITREGHVVGNHTYMHAELKKLSQPKFVAEIERTEQVLAPIIGYTPRFVRPPYGAVNEEELAWLTEQGYLTVNWNVDPEDWRGVSKDVVLKRSIEAAKPGSIILMHSATGTGGSLRGTVDALPQVIENLRAKGYELVTIPELLQTNKGK